VSMLVLCFSLPSQRGRESKSDGGKEKPMSYQDSEAVTIAVKGTGRFDLAFATSSNRTMLAYQTPTTFVASQGTNVVGVPTFSCYDRDMPCGMLQEKRRCHTISPRVL